MSVKKNKGINAAGKKVQVPARRSVFNDPTGDGSTPGTTKMGAKKPPSPPQPLARATRAR